MHRQVRLAIVAIMLLVAVGYLLTVQTPLDRSSLGLKIAEEVPLYSSVGAESASPPTDLSTASISPVETFIDQLVEPTTVIEIEKHRPDTSIPLRLVYDDLKAAADRGDADAALGLAGSLIECAEAPKDAQGLDQQLLNLYQTRRVSGSAFQVQDLELEANRFRDRYEFCQDISRARIKEAYRYIRISAEYGNVEAAVRLNTYGPMLYEEVFEALDIAFESRQEMQSVTDRLHFEAAESGSADAFLWFRRYTDENADLLSADQARAYRIAGLYLAVLYDRNADHYRPRLRQEITLVRPSNRAQLIESVNAILMRENCCFFFR